MPLPPNFLDELRARLPISAVVGRRVRLIRAGRETKACCPFHKEKTPSFTVSDDKGFFHCFGCGAHGDIIGFVMRHDHLSFMEAVEHLAGQAGLTVPQATPEERARAERQKGLHELVESACRFFEAQLQAPGGRRARDYLAGRGLDNDTLARFRLGYAPADGGALIRALKAEGFGDDALVEAGVARRPEDGGTPYAFFRHRVVFPVTDRRGRVVAFGARLLDGDGPKYLNSPDTPLFEKGKLLYSLARARVAAGDGQPVIVAEGYMDVIALVRAGFEAAVAPLGTALTETQIELLWQLAPVPVLCFDGDDAGRAAAWRAADRVLPLLRPDHSVRVAFLPSGDDPDSLIRTSGAAAMQAVVAAARPLAEVLWERELQRHTMTAPEGRAGLKAALLALAEGIADPTVRRFYVSDFHQRIFDGLFQRAQRAFGRPGAPNAGAIAAGPRPNALSARRARLLNLEAEFILTMVLHPALFGEFEEVFAALPEGSDENTALRRLIFDILSAEPEITRDDLIARLAERGSWTVLRRIADLDRNIGLHAPIRRQLLDPDRARDRWLELMSLLGHEMLHAELRELCATLFDGEPRAAPTNDIAGTAGAAESAASADAGTSRKGELLQALYRDNREIMELGRSPQG